MSRKNDERKFRKRWVGKKGLLTEITLSGLGREEKLGRRA